MKVLQLDYSLYRRDLFNKLMGLSILIGILLGFALFFSQKKIDVQLEKYSAKQHQIRIEKKTNTKENLSISAAEMQAIDVQKALNTPWSQLFGALEHVQSLSLGVRLISILPNPKKSELILVGQAEDHAVLTQYIKALQTHKQFTDVMLVNQKQFDEAEKPRLSFTALAKWKQ
ncbi:MAG: hypothetical protein ABIP37_06920 [Methylotenera sp.]